jgi:hypothetical protein
MVGRIILGFVAGMLAVLLIHQPVIAGLAAAKLLPASAVAYNMEPMKTAPAMVASTVAGLGAGIGLKGWPTLFNTVFWGGMWGLFYALTFARLPVGGWLKGLLLGAFIMVFSSWMLMPWIRGQPLFAGYDPMRMAVTAMIALPFGIATGIIFGLMRRAER